MQLPKTLDIYGIRVLTTKQLAAMYETDVQILSKNYTRNKKRYVEGKHLIILKGEEMKHFKGTRQFDGSLKYVSKLYLWTEKGALLHAKSLNTDKAWQTYDYLVDHYFRAKEWTKEDKHSLKEFPTRTNENIPEMNNPLDILRVLLTMANKKDLKVETYPFDGHDSMLSNGVIGLRRGLSLNKTCYELAIALSYACIHYDGGEIIHSPLAKDYEEQATRAATMLIKALDIKLN